MDGYDGGNLCSNTNYLIVFVKVRVRVEIRALLVDYRYNLLCAK